ncbi:MAG: hypothetical protein COV10_04805 [Candidatus Vogelbacteria bacterium CG10_big_fil_rev_8_21_14_0_10_51_16]|uniref:Small ribosomal subunit protein bS6 n=1 Tax=Candidatus Vogelbacteria bacterium CG10_big_fil_rev_8_21_14_0_10_51_16 TaxID=1975045 RepID=A0A2H0RD15_9BACT|nr:MAG: hypothetical protein COV10_04805 [Candidatus Vogelbacteria bacterium CG10_big_fil_rev_8_21_14_0_10_51_16]
MSEDIKDTKLYEFAYHLLPVVAVEALQTEVNSLKGLIEGVGGVVESAELPKMRPLAYVIRKKIANVWQEFTHGHFGVLVFRVPAMAVPEIKVGLDKVETILRGMITESFPYETPTRRLPVAASVGERDSVDSDTQIASKAPTPAPVMSVEEIDKEVEDLIATTV